jgi:hypothetical protein
MSQPFERETEQLFQQYEQTVRDYQQRGCSHVLYGTPRERRAPELYQQCQRIDQSYRKLFNQILDRNYSK